MNPEQAKAAVRQFLANSIVLEEASLPEPGSYGFDPEGWIIFSVADSKLRVGSSRFVAVNAETAEVRDLGFIGD